MNCDYHGFSADFLLKYLNMDFHSGVIKWKQRYAEDFLKSPNPKKQCDDWNRKFSGKQVGNSYSLNGKYYRRFTFFGKTLFVSKVIHLCYYGYIIHGDKIHLDHINGNSLDDSVFNLRYISTKNNVSLKSKTKNKNGFVGVVKQGNRFKAKIRHDGLDIRSCSFETPIEAHIEYLLLRSKYVKVKEIVNE